MSAPGSRVATVAKLYFRYGTMDSAKSMNLLAVAHNYRKQGKRVLLVKPRLDSRFGNDKIASRSGLEATADLMIDEDTALNPADFAELDCVLVDEAQFLTRAQVEQLTDLADRLRIPVLCYGLRTDFLGNLFEGSLWLLAWADNLIELKTICHCGRKATMVLRLDASGAPVKTGAQIEIGGNERYVSVCRRHYKDSQSAWLL